MNIFDFNGGCNFEQRKFSRQFYKGGKINLKISITNAKQTRGDKKVK